MEDEALNPPFVYRETHATALMHLHFLMQFLSGTWGEGYLIDIPPELKAWWWHWMGERRQCVIDAHGTPVANEFTYLLWKATVYDVNADEFPCECCLRNRAIGVASSTMARGMSIAYCRACVDAGAEPEWACLAQLELCGGLEGMAEWAQEIVHASAKYHHADINDWLRRAKEDADAGPAT